MASDIWPKIPKERVIAIDYEEAKLISNPEERAEHQRMLIKRCKAHDSNMIVPLFADILNTQAQLLGYLGKKEEAHEVWLEYKACLARLK